MSESFNDNTQKRSGVPPFLNEEREDPPIYTKCTEIGCEKIVVVPVGCA